MIINMKLKELLKAGNEIELDIICEEDDTTESYLPCFFFNGNLTDKIKRKYSKLLNSNCKVTNDYLIIYFNDAEKVEDFIYEVELLY